MKYLIIAFLLNSGISFADQVSERIKTGMSKVEVSNIIGSQPESEVCTSILGVSTCTLTWKTGFISKTEYVITTVADKVVSVTVKTGKILGL
jgi:hypothetical protein